MGQPRQAGGAVRVCGGVDRAVEGIRFKGISAVKLSERRVALHTECGCFPFLDKVDGKVVSGFVKMVKPNADIYEHLLSEYGLDAGECVFVDDRQENVDAARALGMKGIVFKDYGQACSELNRLIGM